MSATTLVRTMNCCGKVRNRITDENTRSQIFKGHMDFVDTTNAQNLTYRLKVNELADLTTCEFASRCIGYKSTHVWCGLKYLGIHGYVWAFSSTDSP